MSFSHALFHVIAIAAIVHSAWVIVAERWPRPRNRHIASHLRYSERFPPWQAHAPHSTRRYF